MSKNKKPVHEIRLGRIKAAIWENDTQNGVRYNVSISRLYKDEDVWKDSVSFGRDDLPLVGVPVERRDEPPISDRVLQEASKIALVPVDATECFLECVNRCGRQALRHALLRVRSAT